MAQLKRLLRFPSALTRLAFWRKPAMTGETAATAETEAAMVQAAAPTIEQSAGGDPNAEPVPPSLLARLTAKLHRRPKSAAQATDEGESPAHANEAAVEAAQEAEPVPSSFLARLMAKLRPRTKRPPAEAAEAELSATPDEADTEADQDAPRGLKRVLALLSKKIVWIPAKGLVLLATVGTLSLLLWQAGQDRTALESKLKATEQKLQQTTTTKPAPAAPQAAPASPDTPAAGAVAAAGPRPEAAGGDCDLRNAESVALQLKGCIDAFNDETSRQRTPAASR